MRKTRAGFVRGFSILELLVVIVVLVIIASVLLGVLAPFFKERGSSPDFPVKVDACSIA